ncbi:MAG: hypothetical protein V1790_14305 [Planctomycetota bacterium]
MMTSKPGIFRRGYDAVALFALLNMAALVGVVGYLVGTGAVDGEKVRKAALVLRGEPLSVSQAQGEESKPASAVAKPASSKESSVESEEELEIAHRESERIKAELEQRLALNNSILLKVRTEREAFQKERETATKQEQASANVQREEGFRKQVAIMEALSPKVAIQHLLGLSDSDEAAKILMAMETGKAKKIVESAKRGDEMTQMKRILQRVREAAPSRLADLGREGE